MKTVGVTVRSGMPGECLLAGRRRYSECVAEWFDRPGGEPVELRSSDPGWAVAADAWAGRIRAVLAPTTARVEHIGSTAVPGLVAKPVLDLQVAVPNVTEEASYRPALEALGLVLRQREPDHRFFRPAAGEPRTVHVHVCQQGSGWERDHLRFRDQLRADPELAAAYGALKAQLARDHRTDRLAYNEGKTAFIAAAIA